THKQLQSFPTRRSSDLKMNVFVGGKQSEASEHVDNPANANIPKEVFRRLRSTLPSLVNFRGCHRLREGQLRIFHHHASHQGNEKDRKSTRLNSSHGSIS